MNDLEGGEERIQDEKREVFRMRNGKDLDNKRKYLELETGRIFDKKRKVFIMRNQKDLE